MKKLFLILFIASLNIGCIKMREPHWYKVEITYCDGRKPLIKWVESWGEPNNYDIDSYKEAQPRYAGEVNVCNVKTLSKFK